MRLVASALAGVVLSGTAVAQDQKALGAVKLGRYACWAGPVYMFDVTFRSATQYVDREGKTGRYKYDSATRAVTYESGSLEGNYSEYLGEGKIGLTSRPGGRYTTVCDTK